MSVYYAAEIANAAHALAWCGTLKLLLEIDDKEFRFIDHMAGGHPDDTNQGYYEIYYVFYDCPYYEQPELENEALIFFRDLYQNYFKQQ